MNYNTVSSLESVLLQKVTDYNVLVFGVEEIKRLSNWNQHRIHNLLQSLIKKNLITRIKRNNYVLTEHISEHIYNIATETITPSYISFWTALSYYGYTDQQLTTIQLVSTQQKKPMRVSSFTIEPTTFQIQRFFGYHKNQENISIATPEKTFIDSLYQIEKCGGLDEYCKTLENAWGILNQQKLVLGLLRFQNKSIISRMGYIIDHLSLSKSKYIKKLEKNTSQTPVKLNPNNKKKGAYNKKWNILINHQIKRDKIL